MGSVDRGESEGETRALKERNSQVAADTRRALATSTHAHSLDPPCLLAQVPWPAGCPIPLGFLAMRGRQVGGCLQTDLQTQRGIVTAPKIAP